MRRDDTNMLQVSVSGYKGVFDSYEAADEAEQKVEWFARRRETKDAISASFALLELEKYLQLGGAELRRDDEGSDIKLHVLPYHALPAALDGVRTAFEERLRDVRKRQEEAFNTRFPRLEEYAYEIWPVSGVSQTFMVIGATGVGCLYGVYGLLRQLGFEFYAPGADNEQIPARIDFNRAEACFRVPSFPGRRIYSWRKNWADPHLIDWFGKAGINMWGAENPVPGMRKRGIKRGVGNHDMLNRLGYDPDYCIGNPAVVERMTRRMLDLFKAGIWKDADYLDYLGGDMAPRCECAGCRALGNYADREVHVVTILRRALREQYETGSLLHDVPVVYYAYGETEEPPSRPAPADYDPLTTLPQIWPNRCWAHEMDDERCSQDWIQLCYAGMPHEYRAERRSNRSLLESRKLWKMRVGNGGFGFYPYNLAMYFPECSYLTHLGEFRKLRDLGLSLLGYMHIQNGYHQWGMKSLFWYGVTSLMRDADTDPERLQQSFFAFFFKEEAAVAREIARLIDTALLPIQRLKFVLVERMRNDRQLDTAAILGQDDHLAVEGEDKRMPSLEACARLATQALELAEGMRNMNEVRRAWLTYSAGIVHTYFFYLKLRQAMRLGERKEEQLRIAWELHAVSEKLALLKHLPELGISFGHSPNPFEATMIAELVLDLLIRLDLPVGQLEQVLRPETREKIHSSRLPAVGMEMEKEPAYPPKREPLPDIGHERIRFSRKLHTGLRNEGSCFLRHNGAAYWAVVGERLASDGGNKIKGYEIASVGQTEPYVLEVYKGEERIWRRLYQDPVYRQSLGPFVNITAIPESGRAIVTVCVSTPGSGERGEVRAYDLDSGETIWIYRTETIHAGNGSMVGGDLNGDGLTELVFGLNGEIACLQAETGKPVWSFTGDADGRVIICHGSLAMEDIDGDGLPELVFGTEYGTRYAEGRSDMYVLDHQGRPKHALHNLVGDFGSTNTSVVDVDGDGLLEIVTGSLNLVYRKPRHDSVFICFEHYLGNRYDARATGSGRFAAADVNGDGLPEACFISSLRDGGPAAAERPEISIFRLKEGNVTHRLPIPRSWLSTIPLAYDFDGDGLPEFLTGTWYGSGYGCLSEDTFADLYIVNGRGELVFKVTLPDGVYMPSLLSLEGERTQLSFPCYDGNIYIYELPAAGRLERFVCPSASYRRTGEVGL